MLDNNFLIENYKKQIDFVEDYYNESVEIFNNINEKYSNYYANQLELQRINCSDIVARNNAVMISTDYLSSLTLMKKNHLLMTISMLCHIWEQQLQNFSSENGKIIEQYKDSKKRIKNKCNLVNLPYEDKINELRELVNVIKHGEGDSAKKLRIKRPDYFKDPFLSEFMVEDTLRDSEYLLSDPYSIMVSEADLYGYIRTLKMFWDKIAFDYPNG